MSAKANKKLRQIFRKQYREDAHMIASANAEFLRPRPRWFPEWLWIRLLGIFVRVRR